jgi:hypothetical protein
VVAPGVARVQLPMQFPTAMHQALAESLRRPTKKAKATEWIEVYDFVDQKKARQYGRQVMAFSRSLQRYPAFVHQDTLRRLEGRRVAHKVEYSRGTWKIYLRVVDETKNLWDKAKISVSHAKTY